MRRRFWAAVVALVAMAITFEGAGSAATANNAGVMPALPTHQVGDLLLCFVAARGSGTLGTGGWSAVIERTAPFQCKLLYLIADSASEADPAVTYSGAAGDDVIGQCCVIRGADGQDPFDAVSAAVEAFTGVQDIGPIGAIAPDTRDGMVIVCGVKRDDWTSVATLSGDGLTWNEIGEPDATAGTDMGLVWDYAIWSGAAPTLTSKTFTVTGGTSINCLGFMLAIRPPVAPAGIASGEAFGTPSVQQQVQGSGIPSPETFGSPAIAQQVAPTSIASAEAFGSPTVTVGAADQTVSPTSIASAEAFGAAALHQAVSPSGIPSAEAFGAALLEQRLSLSGIQSAEGFGAALLHQQISLSAIVSGEVFGSHVVTVSGGDQPLVPTAIPSREAFGALEIQQEISLPGIASAEVVGALSLVQEIAGAGAISSLEVVGAAAMQLSVEAPGISSLEIFGLPVVVGGASWPYGSSVRATGAAISGPSGHDPILSGSGGSDSALTGTHGEGGSLV